MSAVSERHEGTFKVHAVDACLHFDKAPCSKESRCIGPDNVRPTSFSGFSELPHQTSCPACLAFNHSLKVEKSRSLSAIGRGRTSLQDTPSRFHSAKLFQFCVLCEDLTFRAISQAVLDARSDRPGHVAVATGCRAATEKEQRQHRRRQACSFHLRSSLLCWPCRCR